MSPAPRPGSTARSSRVESSRAVSSSESGESDSVSALGLPPPHPGRRSSSSGRAVQTTSSGTPEPQSTRWSTKSSRSSSAQCRSSKTSTVGRWSASASRNCRQAAKCSERPPPASASAPRPTSGRRLSSDPLGVLQPERRDRLGQLLPGLLRRVALEDPGLRLDHLGERPVADALAVGQRATLSPVGELRLLVDYLPELVHEAALADPGHADERDELRRTLLARAGKSAGQQVELAAAADERRSGLPEVDAEAGACLLRLPDGDQLGLALRRRQAPPPGSRSPASSPAGCSRRRGGRSPGRRTGGAPRCSRRRPRPCPRRRPGRASRVTSASPVLTAMRTSSWPSSTIPSRIASAARTARSGSSSCATGAPKTAITASPMNFSTVPPRRSSSWRSRAWYGESVGSHVLGVERLGACGEADEVGEEHRDDLALLAAARRRGVLERGAAVGAEARVPEVLPAALRAGQHGYRSRSTV